MGALAKTDRVDCRMLAILGESLEPDAAAPRSELMETLQELTRCRDAAVAARTALLNQLGATTTRPAAVEIKRQLRAAETAIENLGAEIEALIGADPRLARRLAILISIPGVGTVTAIALIVGLAEIGSLSAKQAAMIVGLAPIAWDSGQSSGARHIRGGRAHVRRPLYGRGVRHALQLGAQGLLRPPPLKRQKAQSCPYRRHAKARHSRQHPRLRKPDLGATSRLTSVTDAPPQGGRRRPKRCPRKLKSKRRIDPAKRRRPVSARCLQKPKLRQAPGRGENRVRRASRRPAQQATRLFIGCVLVFAKFR